MDSKSIASKFDLMAKQELSIALTAIPSEPVRRFILFTETIREVDYWAVFQNLLPKDNRLSAPDYQLLQWGWNLAAAHLFSPLQTAGAFPICKSTQDTRLSAASLLHQFGRSILMRRSADMIRYGLLTVEETGNGFILRTTDNLTAQYLDTVEFFRLAKLETSMSRQGQGGDKSSSGWQHIARDDIQRFMNAPGSFLCSVKQKKHLESWKQSEIESMMLPLIHPWDSGHGIMMGYDARPEVDFHFLAEATELASEWRTEAGIHPNARLGKIGAGDLTLISTIIISLHVKHIRFALLANKSSSDISVPSSLTIWCPRAELEQSIIDFSGLDGALVREAVAAIAMQPNDIAHLQQRTTQFRPLLIDLGNGLVLRPVSSVITQNPFFSIRTMQEWRDPETTNRLSAPREDWLRSEIYALFQGTRYHCVEGNIKLREGGNFTTDIDAAIFDHVSGELALFQIKWQDFITNDVRQLRSKACNFTKEMDSWAGKVENWIARQGTNGLVKALRLKQKKRYLVSSIYLFGVSRNAARMQGYGFVINHERLAISNWPQFFRLRYEIGPTDNVFHKLHKALRIEMNAVLKYRALPTSMEHLRVRSLLLIFYFATSVDE